MPRRNSTVKIVDGKVVFSQEIIDYFENLRNEENSKYIDEYFDVLSDEGNLSAEKYNGHHIIPCFTFKDETHLTRKETESLADKVEGNIIKLSIYNHILVHYFLWKIYDNYESKYSIQYTIGKNKEINDLSENQIKEIARIREECVEKNQTEEELKEYQKQWYENNKNVISEKSKERYNKNKDTFLERDKKYRQENKEKISERKKIFYINHRDKRLEQMRDYAHQLCFDPINNNTCKLNTLQKRKYANKEKYKNVNPTDCIIQLQA